VQVVDSPVQGLDLQAAVLDLGCGGGGGGVDGSAAGD